MASLNNRLEKLEKKTGQREYAIVWRELDETTENALERHYREHPEHKDESRFDVQVIGWAKDPADSCTWPEKDNA